MYPSFCSVRLLGSKLLPEVISAILIRYVLWPHPPISKCLTEKWALNAGNGGPSRWDCLFLTPFVPKRTEMALPSANQVIPRDKPRHGHAVCTLQLHPPTSPYPTLIAEAEPISKGRKWHHEAESLMTDISTMGRNKKQFIQTQQIHKSHHLMFHEEIWVGWHVATGVAIFSLHVPVFHIHTIHTCL